MPSYPIVTVATERLEVTHRAVDAEALTAQLMPIRDTLLKLFQGMPGKSRGELHRVELGLVVTQGGQVAFATGATRPSLTLTFESRPRPSARSKPAATKAEDVVEIG